MSLAHAVEVVRAVSLDAGSPERVDYDRLLDAMGATNTVDAAYIDDIVEKGDGPDVAEDELRRQWRACGWPTDDPDDTYMSDRFGDHADYED